MKFAKFVELCKKEVKVIDNEEDARGLACFVYFRYVNHTPAHLSELAKIDTTGCFLDQLDYLCTISPGGKMEKKDRLIQYELIKCKLVNGLKKNYLNKAKWIRGNNYGVPWRYITFFDGMIAISNPSGSMKGNFNFPASKTEFNLIKSIFELHCPELQIKFGTETGNHILNLPVVHKFIVNLGSSVGSPNLAYRESTPKKRKAKLKHSEANAPKSLSIKQVKKEVKSSQYFDRLCELHSKQYPVYYTPEHRVGAYSASLEKAFMFTVEIAMNKWLIIFENTNMKRATIVFRVNAKSHRKAVNEIHNFFISGENNKRESLQCKKITFSNRIISYDRIYHNDYSQWWCDIEFH